MAYYLCVDCGGTKTQAVIANANGEIVGRGLAGGSNFAYIGPATFREAVKAAVETAFPNPPSATSPVTFPPADGTSHFAAAWFGVAGCDSPTDVQTVTELVASLLNIPIGPAISVCNDTHLLAAPLTLHDDTKYAVSCIGGTGSIVVSFTQPPGSHLPEELGRHGGWGWILGDNGGGYDVGREALRALLLVYDRSSVGYPLPDSTLYRSVLMHFGTENPLDVLRFVHDADPLTGQSAASPEVQRHLLIRREARVSGLSPLVFKAAFEDADPVALGVLDKTSLALAEQIDLLLLDPASTVEPPTPAKAIRAAEAVLCFGGSLVGIEKYRAMVLEHLKTKGHVFRHVEFVSDPAGLGAKALAVGAKTA